MPKMKHNLSTKILHDLEMTFQCQGRSRVSVANERYYYYFIL